MSLKVTEVLEHHPGEEVTPWHVHFMSSVSKTGTDGSVHACMRTHTSRIQKILLFFRQNTRHVGRDVNH